MKPYRRTLPRQKKPWRPESGGGDGSRGQWCGGVAHEPRRFVAGVAIGIRHIGGHPDEATGGDEAAGPADHELNDALFDDEDRVAGAIAARADLHGWRQAMDI